MMSLCKAEKEKEKKERRKFLDFPSRIQILSHFFSCFVVFLLFCIGGCLICTCERGKQKIDVFFYEYRFLLFCFNFGKNGGNRKK